MWVWVEVRVGSFDLRLREEKRIVMGGGQGHGTTYKGVTIHQPKRWHTITGKGLCAVMWSVSTSLLLYSLLISFALISWIY